VETKRTLFVLISLRQGVEQCRFINGMKVVSFWQRCRINE